MHIGLNLVYLVPGSTGGTEVYARELIPELAAQAPQHRFTAFVGREMTGPGPWSELDGCVVVPVNASNRLDWVRGEQSLLPRLAARAGVDLLHSLANTAPGWGRFRRVTTVHDLIHRQVPDAHPGLRSIGMRVLVPLAARRSHRVIADTESTAAELRRMRGVAPDRVDVIPLGVGTGQRAEPLPESQVRAWLRAGERPILLSVSAKLAHKNLLRLLGALARLPAGDRPLLVLPGYPTAHEQQLRERAAQLNLTDDVRFEGWVSAPQLEGLYGAAAGFVFPSLAEGFGLPILEAMARDVPVACSNRGAIAEVAGDAALLFDPESETEIADAIRALIADRGLARRLIEAGRRRVPGFSWRTTAALTLASYERAGRLPDGAAGTMTPPAPRRAR